MDRYSRQILFKSIGKEGQEKLSKSTVCIIGVGALGSVCADLLARAGVGRIILIEGDSLDTTNLHRQTLYDETGIGKKKAILAKERLSKINSGITIEAYPEHLSGNNMQLIGNPDIIIASTDNLESRRLLNEYALREKVPWIYGAAIEDKGTIYDIFPGGPCLTCILRNGKGESSSVAGIMNTTASLVGTLMANEAIKILTGQEHEKDMLRINLKSNEFTKIKIAKDKDCPSCKELR